MAVAEPVNKVLATTSISTRGAWKQQANQIKGWVSVQSGQLIFGGYDPKSTDTTKMWCTARVMFGSRL